MSLLKHFRGGTKRDDYQQNALLLIIVITLKTINAIAQGLRPLEADRKIVIYCRVSSNAQKLELKNQVAAMQTFCLNRGLAIDNTISEIGGGLNFKRKKFMSLIVSMLKGESQMIVVAHKDRLCRFDARFHRTITRLKRL